MKTKFTCRDIDGNYISSDCIIYNDYEEENYTYNNCLLNPEEYYKRILKENQELERKNWNYQ